MRYLIIDLNNLANRAVHVVKNPESVDDWIGRTLIIVFHSMRRHFEKFQCDHAVICADSWSWRETIYETYKVNRKLDPATSKARKIEAKKVSHQTIDELVEYFKEETNVTILKSKGIEADDFIGRWVQVHNFPNLEHVILSNDSDFKQLVRDRVDLFDPLPSLLYTSTGILYQDDQSSEWVRSVQRYGETWKVKVNELDEPIGFDPSWELFVKCIRGDVRDNIKPAYPRVSELRMREAFDDRGGPKWNNLINSTWGKTDDMHSVRDLYDLNRKLIDLSAQPVEIIDQMDAEIDRAISKAPMQMVGAYFEKLCRKYRLEKLLEARSAILPVLSNPYRLS